MSNYSSQLRDPRWQRRRLKRLEAADWRCQQCGRNDLPLHVHHTHYIRHRKVWQYPDAMLRVLCEDCHEKISDAPPEIVAAIAILRNIPDDVYCDRCGGIVTNAMGYGWDKKARKFWCEPCVREMEGVAP